MECDLDTYPDGRGVRERERELGGFGSGVGAIW